MTNHMEFIVTRTADRGNSSRPCEEATPKTISYNVFGKHYEKSVWVVQFRDLNDLVSFYNKHDCLRYVGKTVFGTNDNDELVVYDAIEIY